MLPFNATCYNDTEKTWVGPQLKDLYHQNATLAEVILLELNKNPQKIVQISDSSEEKLTAGQLMDNALKLSSNLRQMGFTKGNVIGLYAHNSTHVASVMLASWINGTPVHAAFPGFDSETLASIYNSTKPCVLFCDVENYQIAKKTFENLNSNASIYLMNGELEGVSNIKEILQSNEERKMLYLNLPCSELTGDDTAVILCSSGTTGTPKGVLCSHRSLLSQNIFFTLKSESVIFTFSTMYWASGLHCLIPSLTHCALRIITEKPFSSEYLLYLLDKYKITHMMANATQMAEIVLNEDHEKIGKYLTSMDTLLCGGSKVPILVQQKMNQILSSNTNRPGFCVSYGMSELFGMLCCSGGYPYARLEGSEGKLAPNKQVRILDKQGNRLPPNEHGQIVISTLYKWSGYFDNTKATNKALIDGWLHTGDLGYFDEVGFLHVCARDNDVFKSNNFQIYPTVIEEIILRIPGVAEVCVFGIPDHRLSNLTSCALVRSQDAEGQRLTEKLIVDYVENNISSVYHLTGGVYFVGRLPKTGSGKVQRRKMLDMIKDTK